MSNAVFCLLLLFSCVNYNFTLRSKCCLGDDIVRSLKLSGDCECDGVGECDICKIRNGNLEEWIEKDDLVEFKDSDLRNKLMILIGDLERGNDCKKQLISICVDRLISSLDGEVEDNLKKLKEFDSKDTASRRTVSYMLIKGMMDELKEFLKRASSTVNYKYDFGISQSLLEGRAPLCTLAERVKKESELKEILDKIVDKFPKIANSSLDDSGNTVYHLCSIYGNEALFNYFRGRREFKKGFLSIKNKFLLKPIFIAIKRHEHEVFKAILVEELKGKPEEFDTDDEIREYGRQLLMIAAISCNDEALDTLFEKKASTGGCKLKRIKETLKKTGKFLLDILAKTTDIAASYGSAAAFGVPYKGDLASAVLISYKKYLAANKPVLLNKEEIERAFSYLEDHHYKRIDAIYDEFYSVWLEFQELALQLEKFLTKSCKKKTDLILKNFNKLKSEKKSFEKKRCKFFSKAFTDKKEFVNKAMKDYDRFDEIRLELLSLNKEFKRFSDEAKDAFSKRINN